MRKMKFKSMWLVTVIILAWVLGFLYTPMTEAANYENQPKTRPTKSA